MLLPLHALAVFTADNEQITLDLSVQACKNANLSLSNVAWYVLLAVQSRSSAVSGIVLFTLYLHKCQLSQ